MIFRYVPHDRVIDYFHVGWMWAADLGDYHSEFACLMCWPCDCHCAEPT